ncbi:polyprenyl synthetase family protein [Micromonospora sp. DSM 115977]|uniref:Polyprenyl synthetase family protein n=1 Tax=Micromonospora reichwaldensis TaxID=3075516 RepID=A0ABU2X237_9ACTN|nr:MULTISPECIES: polyprenyl synthetase family protein [unclassified Micromonospora]KAB1153040.1 polyprenyl synthetase family protein [Micromonospora sp. AMSO12t]MDT0531830.1 polyprenyl synthetase family protein [Micromonospora sp. DSM 115977]WSG03859.1 polyprenyl synthetase family protein [Micromonospora sp. NBC_01740]
MVDGVVNPAGERSGASGSGGRRTRVSTSQFGALGLYLADPRVEASVLGLLEGVESELRASVASADPFVTEAARHLVEAGGKRFRPLLVALGAQFGDPTGPQVVPAAVVMELTHLATLYHDDVMDEAAVRRGAPSANSRWTNSVAILVGDYLFARAADIAADLGIEAVRLQARTFARLVHGQIAETVGPRPGDDPVAHYLDVIAGKTGSLIATSARFGGMFGGAAPEHTEALAGYGETIGVAFQLSDDLLDIASESVESGKTPGTDLREGVPTLPVLYALGSDDADAASVRLREILATGPLTDDDLHAEALGLLRESPALKRARETVRSYAEDAREQLSPLPQGPARRALESLCDYIADRTS